MQDPNTHRELVANVGNLKFSVRGVILAVSQQTASRIPASVQRADDSVGNLRKLLLSVADQTARLPLETSKRLADIEVHQLIADLLQACQPAAPWPAPDAEGSTIAALQHPSWPAVQQLISQVFEVVTLLCGVAIRACTRSADPLMILMQVASAKAMGACVLYMQQLWHVHAAARCASADTDSHISVGATTAGTVSAAASDSFASAVAAFSSCYSLLASAVDGQLGLQELELQLVSSLCSSTFLPTAVQLLQEATCSDAAQYSNLEAQCQQASWQLLTLALFLSGGDVAVSPAAPSISLRAAQGQHIPSSVLAERLRLAGKQHSPTGMSAAAAAASAVAKADMAAAEAATGLPLASMQQQVACEQVLVFLQERLYHAVQEMNSAGSGTQGMLCYPGLPPSEAGQAAEATQQIRLLPGKCAPADHDVLAAMLRALRCWRALLVGPAGPSLPIVSSAGVELLLDVLRGIVAESIRGSSSEREALRGRLMRVAVHCLQLLCGYVSPDLLALQLRNLTAALAGVVGSAGAFFDANKRAVKSAELPFTGQVRCMDRATGDMMVRHMMAAQSALAVLLQLVVSCRQEATLSGVADEELVQVMLSAGLIPALEQLYRQVPGVSPAHVTAADLLAQLLGLRHRCDLSAGHLPLLATLRKFIVKSAGVPEPDRQAAVATALRLADMLANLAGGYDGDGQSGILLKHAAAQLLPGLQVFCSIILKGPVPAVCRTTLAGSIDVATLASAPSAAATPAGANVPCCHLYPAILAMFQNLAAAASMHPQLGLLEDLLGNQALSLTSSIIISNYWVCPYVAAPAVSCTANASLTAHHAAQLLVSTLLDLTAAPPAAAPPASSAARGGPWLALRLSTSSDCLMAVKPDESSCVGSGGGSVCQLGTWKCCVDGVCSCGSPRACSDVVAAPGTLQTSIGELGQGSGLRAVPRQQQQVLLLLSALLQSKLLPEVQHLLQQLPTAGRGGGGRLLGGGSLPGGAGTPRHSAARSSSAGAFGGSAAVPVPAKKVGSLSRQGSGKVTGLSPPSSLTINQPLRVQLLASQQQSMSTFTGGQPSSYGSSISSQQQGSSSRCGPCGSLQSSGFAAAPSSSPRALMGRSPPGTADGAAVRNPKVDVGGLLRGGSWSSLNNALLPASASAPHDLRLGRQTSSGLASSSSGSLGSLAALALSADLQEVDTTGSGKPVAPPAMATVAAVDELQQKLELVLLAVARAVLDLVDCGLLGDTQQGPPRLSSASGLLGDTQQGPPRLSSASGISCGMGSSSGEGGVEVGLALSSYQLQGTTGTGRLSYPGSQPLTPLQGNALSALRSILATAQPAYVMGLLHQGSEGCGASPHSCAEGATTDGLFPVELGLGRDTTSVEDGQAMSPVPTTPTAGAGAAGRLPADVIGQLMGAVASVGPALARQCAAFELDWCDQVLMARVCPRLAGCWNPSCTNMAGTSEMSLPAKPCGNCKVAVFCSKGCEKAAWPRHIGACSRLAAVAAGQQA